MGGKFMTKCSQLLVCVCLFLITHNCILIHCINKKSAFSIQVTDEGVLVLVSGICSKNLKVTFNMF